MNSDASEFTAVIDDTAYGDRRIRRAIGAGRPVKTAETAQDRLSSPALISPEHRRLIKKLETIAELSMAQKELFASLPLRIRIVPAGTEIIREAQRPSECCLILDGLAGRYKMVTDGQRQIVSLHLPGDVPDLQSLYLDDVDFGLCALTPTRLAFITHEALRDIMAHDAGVAAILMKYIAIDGSIFREWIVNLGSRAALRRVAHLLCEFFVCRRALGMAPDNVLGLPLTQAELADVTGLSVVHVNRVLKQLRLAGCISGRGNLNRITDWAELVRIADFSPQYLHLKSSDAHLGI